MPLTILLMVSMINAVNFIDGLDGLAAGVVGIASIAFFAFTVVSGGQGLTEAVPTTAPLVAAITAGVCLGFLVHNFHPAKIFMGDTGSMTLGLLLASAAVVLRRAVHGPDLLRLRRARSRWPSRCWCWPSRSWTPPSPSPGAPTGASRSPRPTGATCTTC